MWLNLPPASMLTHVAHYTPLSLPLQEVHMYHSCLPALAHCTDGSRCQKRLPAAHAVATVTSHDCLVGVNQQWEENPQAPLPSTQFSMV